MVAQTRLKILYHLLLLILISTLQIGCTREQRWPGYVGSSSCRECHEDFYQLWSTSHHGLAMQPVTPELVASTLTPLEQAIEVEGKLYSVDLKHRKIIETTDGKVTARFPMLHAMGGKNVIFFLTMLERGRLQVLPLAYDVIDNFWYDTTGSMLRHFTSESDEALAWRDPMLTFNTGCFGCHVSQLSKNYDPVKDEYHTTWREPGISCESCHGPSEEHNERCRKLKPGEKPEPLGLLRWADLTPSQVNSACAPCHAKAYPLTPEYPPAEDFFDHFDLITLEHNDFSPDGRDLGENYTYTLWMLNPCAKNEKLDCVYCHTSSGRYRFRDEVTSDVNAACTQCHSDKRENIAAHSRHPAESAAGRCIACHMPTTRFAAMRRSDHSHRPPSPQAAELYGATSACILCHKDQSESWAAEFVRVWHPDSTIRPRMLREADLVNAARHSDWSKLNDMLTYMSEENSEPVVTTSLLRLIPRSSDPRIWPAIQQLLWDPSPLVRGAAAAALRDNLNSNSSVEALCRVLNDKSRLVRIQAAHSLAPYPRRALDPATRNLLAQAETELIAMFTARPDDWSTHYNYGNYLQLRSDPKGALKSFNTAIRLRPDVIMPYVNASILHSQQGNLTDALAMLRQAHQLQPDHGAVNLNLGLALAEHGDPLAAIRHLRTAMNDTNCLAQAAFNCAVLTGRNDPAAAAELCKQALEVEPANQRYLEAYNYYRNR